ncbi:MAG: hypothetical protein H6981_11255 [Gammaproteobacteria bacterium]|nr:hypothetical protein [Gammaproteobacteria bacterium]
MRIATLPLRPLQTRSLPDYFRDRLHQGAAEQSIPTDEDTLWYLGELMSRFALSDHLFDANAGRRGIRPLALLYADARESADEQHRCRVLQRLGDLALFLGALYPEIFARRGVRRDYFVGMGSSAYDYLADNARANRAVFRRLTHRFAHWLNLIAFAAEREAGMSAGDILRLHTLWRETGNPRLAEQLRLLGIHPDTCHAVH